MTLFYYNSLFLEHQTGDHPERPARLAKVVEHLQNSDLESRLTHREWLPVSREQLCRIHQPTYVEQVARYSAAGGGWIEEDTICSPRSYEVALCATGAVCDAVDRVMRGEDQNAFCLVRPPGHHALSDSAMGFCLFNNIAVGAQRALDEYGLNRLLIVDWDVHHGNGTQATFWEDGRVGFLSIHRWPFYPGTGRSDETGGGSAVGTKLNLPIEFGTPRRVFLDQFRSGLEWLAKKIRPELVLISAGFDAHRDDPIGSLELDTKDFGSLTRYVLNVAETYAGGKVVSVLEGGYNTEALAQSVEVHLQELLALRA